MGCNCQKTPGFKEQLRIAKTMTERTGETYVVYVHKATKSVFMRTESSLTDELGICCYFLPDGTEVLYTPKATETIQAEEVEVVQPEVVTKTKKAAKDA